MGNREMSTILRRPQNAVIAMLSRALLLAALVPTTLAHRHDETTTSSSDSRADVDGWVAWFIFILFLMALLACGVVPALQYYYVVPIPTPSEELVAPKPTKHHISRKQMSLENK